ASPRSAIGHDASSGGCPPLRPTSPVTACGGVSVIASTDPLAGDVVGARLLGVKIQAVRHLWEASRLEIGESDEDKMRFPPMSLRDAIEAYTLVAYGERLTFEHE